MKNGVWKNFYITLQKMQEIYPMGDAWDIAESSEVNRLIKEGKSFENEVILRHRRGKNCTKFCLMSFNNI